MTDPIRFTLDGEAVEAGPDETIWQVAKRCGTDIPHLCHSPRPGYRADGNCRACMVEIEGERVLAASCLRKPAAGMRVHSANERARSAQRMVIELLVADQPARELAHDRDSHLWQWADRLGVADSRFPRREAPAADSSHPAMRVALDACIHCNLCVRACREVQVNDVIGMAFRGHRARIVFDQDDPMGASTCVACGECVQACPTGALMPATLVDERGVGPIGGRTGGLSEVDSVCPFCGVGCLLTYQVRDNKIVAVTGRDGPANEGRLCVKGRFGFDYINSPQRLTKPLIRRDDAPKRGDLDLDPKNPLTHVSMLNALLNVIVTEQLYDRAYIDAHTAGFENLKAHIAAFTPGAMAPICGIDAETLRTVARTYAIAKASIIFWGMGVSQHIHGTDNCRCLIALALITGQIGRPGTGLHPLRGQNNVQGASDAGLIPMMLPNYQSVENGDIRRRFEDIWGTPLDPLKGLTVVETMDSIHAGKVKGMIIMGENPAMSDPNVQHARDGLAKLEHLVVQDIFLTETAFHADVVLPASAWPEKDGTVTNTNRQVQRGRKAVELPGEARQDWWISNELAQRIGCDWYFDHPREIYAEMASVMPSLDNISWERVAAEDSVTYPCKAPDQPGDAIVFSDGFPTPSGRGKLVPASIIPPDEVPDETYPMVLTTGRQLEHWHTGAMTRRAAVLDELEPEAVATLSPADLNRMHIEPGAIVRVSTRRGVLELRARADGAVPDGMVFIPFCYAEAPANVLTNQALDPYGKIPELKYCAARVEAV